MKFVQKIETTVTNADGVSTDKIELTYRANDGTVYTGVYADQQCAMHELAGVFGADKIQRLADSGNLAQVSAWFDIIVRSMQNQL